MIEETVTKAIINWLIKHEWEIVCFDFPQSGTGRFLHPNGTKEKNKDSISPDIVAVKGDICVFFENKSFFYFKDFQKINMLINTDKYSAAIDELLKKYHINSIFYGIGYPSTVHKKARKDLLDLVDFVIGVTENREVEILYTVNDSIFY